MKFWIGDPCYHSMFHESMGGSHDVWLGLLNAANYFDNGEELIFMEERRIGAHSTAYGDGVYFDDEGREYAVDSGLLGYVEWREGDPESIDGLHLVEFHEVPALNYGNGIVSIGYVYIDTDPRGTDDLEDEEDYTCDDYEEN